MPKFDPMTGELIVEETTGEATGKTPGEGTVSIAENQTDIGPENSLCQGLIR